MLWSSLRHVSVRLLSFFFLSRYVLRAGHHGLTSTFAYNIFAYTHLVLSPSISPWKMAKMLAKWRKCYRRLCLVPAESMHAGRQTRRERERERGRDRERGGESEREEQQTTYWDLGSLTYLLYSLLYNNGLWSWEVHFLATSPECDDACRAACPWCRHLSGQTRLQRFNLDCLMKNG